MVESERRPDDFDGLENMLYTAAIQAGWLSSDRDGRSNQVAEVPDVEMLVRIARPRPRP